MINKLRSNSYNLNESLHRKEYIVSPRYERGAKYQDIKHLVLRCNYYDAARNKLYRELEKLKVKYPYDVWDWLRRPDIAQLKLVWKFLQETEKII